MKIICYMYSSLDGRIDCEMTEKIDPEAKAYYNYFNSSGIKNQINGKTTHALHYAEKGEFKAENYVPSGRQIYAAEKSGQYQICFDTKGTLLWSSDKIEGKNLICVVSEKASTEYLDYLRQKKISYVACGKEKIDLKESVEILEREFGIHSALLTGGGHLNAAFLDAGLIDEVHMMYGPGIDGRSGWTCAFDGRSDEKNPVVLKLLEVKQVENDTVLIKYKV